MSFEPRPYFRFRPTVDSSEFSEREDGGTTYRVERCVDCCVDLSYNEGPTVVYFHVVDVDSSDVTNFLVHSKKYSVWNRHDHSGFPNGYVSRNECLVKTLYLAGSLCGVVSADILWSLFMELEVFAYVDQGADLVAGKPSIVEAFLPKFWAKSKADRLRARSDLVKSVMET